MEIQRKFGIMFLYLSLALLVFFPSLSLCLSGKKEKDVESAFSPTLCCMSHSCIFDPNLRFQIYFSTWNSCNSSGSPYVDKNKYFNYKPSFRLVQNKTLRLNRGRSKSEQRFQPGIDDRLWNMIR